MADPTPTATTARLGGTLRTIGRMLAISWRADRVRSVLTGLTASGQFVALPFRALGLTVVADGIVAGNRDRALAGVAVVVASGVTNRLMAWASLNVRMRLREHTQLYLDTHLMGLTAGIPGIEHHETPEFLDAVERLRAERHYLANPFNPISWTVASLVQAAVVVVLLARVDPVLGLLPFFGLPAAVAAARAEHHGIALRDTLAEASRTLRHLFHLTTDPGPAKEVRIYGLGPELLGRRQRVFAGIEARHSALARGNVGRVGAAWVVFAAAYAAALAWTVHGVDTGRLRLGELVLVLNLGAQLNGQLVELAFNVGWFARSLRAVRRLVWFADHAAGARQAFAVADPVAPPAALHTGIRLDHVGFTYPGTSRPVLHDVDLLLPAGSTIAVVGENGSGKTTLVKLLARLYRPTTGRVLADGVDLADIEVDAWRSVLSAGFQDFYRFALHARATVGVGDVSREPDDDLVLAALARAVAGDLPDQLPDGLDTQLGRELDGVDLSGGQWQKLALGRAMVRQAPLLLVLDEPTASIDAATEHALYERFAGAGRDVAAATGGITVLVSHRFSTVRMADLIVVLDRGRITEQGTHADLLAADGTYAELFHLQARAYQTG